MHIDCKSGRFCCYVWYDHDSGTSASVLGYLFSIYTVAGSQSGHHLLKNILSQSIYKVKLNC